jgi:1,4-dihydroxy-2-naphthoyl-CoA hydrolase
MKIWKSDINVDLLSQRAANTMSDFLGIVFTEVGSDYLLASMPVNERTKQPLGIMHGGASCVLAETVGSTAANYCVDLTKVYCVGLDINTNHIRSIGDGIVYARAVPFHLGKSTHVWHIEIRDKENQLISVTRLTMAVLKRPA